MELDEIKAGEHERERKLYQRFSNPKSAREAVRTYKNKLEYVRAEERRLYLSYLKNTQWYARDESSHQGQANDGEEAQCESWPLLLAGELYERGRKTWRLLGDCRSTKGRLLRRWRGKPLRKDWGRLAW
jgi:hypothetical protein